MNFIKQFLLSNVLGFLDKLPLNRFKTIIGAVLTAVTIAVGYVPPSVAGWINDIIVYFGGLGYTPAEAPSEDAFYAAIGLVLVGIVHKARKFFEKKESK